MAQMIVRNIGEDLKAGLKRLAGQHGWSMEEEVRQILRRAVQEGGNETSAKLGTRMAACFAGNGLDEPLPEWHGDEARPMDVGAGR